MESEPKSTPSKGIDMLCGQGPIMTRLTFELLLSAAYPSRSLSAKLSYQPPTEKTGTCTFAIWSRVLMPFQIESYAGCSSTCWNMPETQPVAATSAVRSG